MKILNLNLAHHYKPHIFSTRANQVFTVPPNIYCNRNSFTLHLTSLFLNKSVLQFSLHNYFPTDHWLISMLLFTEMSPTWVHNRTSQLEFTAEHIAKSLSTSMLFSLIMSEFTLNWKYILIPIGYIQGDRKQNNWA